MDEVLRKDVRIGDTSSCVAPATSFPKSCASIPEKRPPNARMLELPSRARSAARTSIARKGVALRVFGRSRLPGAVAGSTRHLHRAARWTSTAFAERLVDNSVASGALRTPRDLFTLTAEEIAGLERMGPKSPTNLSRCARAQQADDAAAFPVRARHSRRRRGHGLALAEHFGDLEPLQASTLRRDPAGSRRRARGGRAHVREFFDERAQSPRDHAVARARRDVGPSSSGPCRRRQVH
jgi:DNA ligase (NAD+)